MGERYWITGVQLGLLVATSDEKREELIDEIIDKQYIGNANEPDKLKMDIINLLNKPEFFLSG